MDPDKEFPPPPPSQADPKLIGYIEQSEDKKPVRLFPWFFAGFNIVMLIWLISGIVAASNTHCDPTLATHACTTARQVGGAAGALVVGVVWAILDVIILGLWSVFHFTRKER